MTTDLYQIKQHYNSQYGDRQYYLYEYYRAKNNPIQSRQPISVAKATSHTNLHVDFMGDIVDLKVGYMGQHIEFTPNIKKKVLHDKVALELKIFDRLNNGAVLNSESVRWSAISGISHRLLYTEDGLIKAKNIPGWQVVYDYNDDPLNATAAYYFFEKENLIGETTKWCYVYDATDVTYYKGPTRTLTGSDTAKSAKADGDIYTKVESQPHNFTEVPIFPLVNNDLWAGDCDKSVPLMDIYDELISDGSAEIKSMRLAYLKMWGTIYTGKDLEGNDIDVNTWMKQTSSMIFATNDDGTKAGDAEFLEKNINDDAVENMLNRMRTHIFEVSGSMDLKELVDITRAYAAKTSLLRLENNAATTERYMRGFLYKQIRLMTYWYNVYNGLAVSPTDIDITFTRTLPKDTSSDADSLEKLVKVLTVEDSLRILGYTDAKELAGRVKAEKAMGTVDSQPGTEA